MQHVRRFLAQTGGVRRLPPQRSAHHLTIHEREEISRGIAAGHAARSIARRLGRAASSISREIARNGGRTDYRAQTAKARAQRRARRPKPAKLACCPWLQAIVEQKLALCWSPQQITGWLRRTYPNDAAMQISHETIYLSLFDPRRRALDRRLTRRLRTARAMRYPRAARQPTGKGCLQDMRCISTRPAEVADRRVPGHGEGDLIMGARPSASGTLVERTSRYVRLFRLLEGLKAEQVRPHLT
jgi:IS30 family transposase